MKLAVERQATFGPLDKDLDNNRNFSPDGRLLVFDCRDQQGLPYSRHLGILELSSREIEIVYSLPRELRGVGAASFLSDREVVAIHPLLSGLAYEATVRGGRIVPLTGAEPRWLESRQVKPPFVPGALRGGTHKHEPDFTGEWVGFTYNDHWMRQTPGSDLRNVGVSRRGIRVPVPESPESFTGESFSVLLTACSDNPRPGSDEFRRAEGDCWAGIDGYLKAGSHQRARAFRGVVCVEQGPSLAYYSDVFLVDVPEDISVPGEGPLEGTATAYPAPPKGAEVRRLTHTARNANPLLRGVSGHCRASGDGRWIAFVGKALRNARIENQVFVVSPQTGEGRQVSRIEGGVVGDARFSDDGRYIAAPLPDGGIAAFSPREGKSYAPLLRTPPQREAASRIVISPDSRTIAFNRLTDGVMQVFTVDSGEALP